MNSGFIFLDRQGGLSLRVVLSKWHGRDNPLWVVLYSDRHGPRGDERGTPLVHGLDLLPRPAAFDFGLFAESLLRFGAGRAQGLLSPVVGIPLALRALPVV